MKTSIIKLLLLSLLVFSFCFSSEAKITRYLTGSSLDVNPPLFGPAHDLGGGGLDIDPAIQWMIDQARGCTNCTAKVDVVVLRASGSDGYNASVYAMNGVDSVESIVVTSRKDSSNAALIATIQKAEVIFFAGGDQCNYTSYFKGTPVETAVESVYRRGGAIGGTSAGAAIQGHFVYDACTGSAISADALANPYNRSISFSYGFFEWNNFGNTITDSHFAQRDRMGRLMAFLARQIADGKSASALGIGLSEETSVVVDKNGLAIVMGAGNAYFVLADHAPESCLPGTPLTYSNFKVWRLSAGAAFDLRDRPSTGFYTVSVANGILSGNPY